MIIMPNLTNTSISVLPRDLWISGAREKENIQRDSVRTTIENVTAKITNVLSETFPELEDISESRFLQFHAKLARVLRDNIVPK